MMRMTVVLGLSALLLSVLTGCSGLSRPDEIRVVKAEVMANPPMPQPAADATRRGGTNPLGKPGPRPPGQRRSGG